jgi:hypothetical protein
MVMTCVAEIWKNTQAYSECWIIKGMHEYPSVDRCNLPTMVECPPWIGEV